VRQNSASIREDSILFVTSNKSPTRRNDMKKLLTIAAVLAIASFATSAIKADEMDRETKGKNGPAQAAGSDKVTSGSELDKESPDQSHGWRWRRGWYGGIGFGGGFGGGFYPSTVSYYSSFPTYPSYYTSYYPTYSYYGGPSFYHARRFYGPVCW
jgi:hypothetical protein